MSAPYRLRGTAGPSRAGDEHLPRALPVLLAGLLLLCCRLAPGCSEQPQIDTFSLHGAEEVALVCRDMAALQGLPLEQCGPGGSGSLFAFVSSPARSELALLRLTRRNGAQLIQDVQLQEFDHAIPGITHLKVGRQPARLLLEPQGRFLFTLDNGSSGITAVDVGRACAVGRIPWGDGSAGALAAADMTHDGSDTLLVSFPGSGVIAALDTGDCGFAAAACQAIGEVPPLPTVREGGYDKSLHTGHGEHACDDGVDNDEDGKIDHEDPGCGTPDDRSEQRGYDTDLHTGQRSSWACDDGRDNDGDGRTDLDDSGCTSPSDTSEIGCELHVVADLRHGPAAGALAEQGIATASPGFLAWRAVRATEPEVGPTLLVGDALLDFVYELHLGSSPDDAMLVGRFGLSPACGDGLDNDGDSLVDLADAECTSDNDDSESAGFADPACSDGKDNDGDGLTDLEDPGCTAGGDTQESGPYPVPQCANGQDDDGDGLVDWADPGCVNEEDRDETDPPSPPQCANGKDDDGDRLVDLEDRGCAAAGDPSERSALDASGREQPPACDDGEDNDGDGLVDGADPDCSHPGDLAEWTPPTACDDGLDNDGDGLVDLLDPGCSGAADPQEGAPPGVEVLPACADGLDNDGDGWIDAEDPGCAAAGDDDERQPAPACSNGLDDDGDRLIDLADPGCAGPDGSDEAPDRLVACNNGRDDDGDELVDLADPDCLAAGDDSESFSAVQSGWSDSCANGKDDDGDGLADGKDGWCQLTGMRGDEAHKPACADGRDNDGDGRVDFMPEVTATGSASAPARQADPGCQGPADGSELDLAPCAGAEAGTPGGCFGPGDLRRSLPQQRKASRCSDGLDNDGDGLIDAHDLGCSSAWDEDEAPAVPSDDGDADPRTACSDGLDNDGDGRIDLADDGCAAAGDEEEGAAEGNPQCANGLDDDGDGLADYPDDPDCPGPGWDNERGPWLMPACANGHDDDGDGLVDRADVQSCLLAGSDGERASPDSCHDGLDNDQDGFADALDDDCLASPPHEALLLLPREQRACLVAGKAEGDPQQEQDPWCATTDGALDVAPMAVQQLPACANGRDDDGDRLVDADDPGCSAPLDDKEVEEDERTECSEADLREHPECSYAGGDPTARAIPPQCADGIDNDQDGRVDEADPGCRDEGGAYAAEWDSEWDGPRPSQCSNGFADELAEQLRGRYTQPEAERWDLLSPGCFDPADDLEARRSLLPDCDDRTMTDDDGDGKANAQDPGCFGPGDDDETDGTIVPSCSDGLDNDGDGLPDPLERPGDGIDNDGDGQTDEPEELPGDGIDNDGDGETDERPTEICSYAGAREDGPRAAGLAGLALTPDGGFLYALHRWQQAVVVLDLRTGKVVDTRPAEPFHVRKGVTLGAPPMALAMACSSPDAAREGVLLPEVCREDSAEVIAYVTSADGQVSAIQVKAGGTDVHRPVDATPGDGASVASVTLHDASGRQLEKAPNVPDWFPAFSFNAASQGGLQPLGISLSSELGPENPYGLRMGPELLQNRTWQVIWEGEVPFSRSKTGRFTWKPSTGEAEIAADVLSLNDIEAGSCLPALTAYSAYSISDVLVLNDIEADFCQLGVLPGDRLLLLSRYAERDRPDDCSRLFGEKALEGREGFEYCIAAVWPHELQLQAVPVDGTPAGPGVPCPEVDPRRRLVPAAAIGQPSSYAQEIGDEGGEEILVAAKRPLDPLPLGSTGEDLLTSCFPELVSYRIRASGHFLVYAQGDGLSHNYTSRYGRCELQRSPNALLQSRAWVGIPFRNEALGFTLHAAPEPEQVGLLFPEHGFRGVPDPRTNRPPRSTFWRIEVRSELNPLRYNLGSLLGGVAVDPIRGRLYLGETGRQRLWEVLPATGTIRLVSQ